METFFESGVLLDAEEEILEAIEMRLKSMQQAKFKFTRGPDGYLRIKKEAQALEAERKERRRLQYDEKARGQSSENYDSMLKDIKETDISEDVDYVVEKPTSCRKRTSYTKPQISKDDIFELELDDACKDARVEQVPLVSPVKQKKTWKKLSLNAKDLDSPGRSQESASASPSTTPPLWSAQGSQDKYVLILDCCLINRFLIISTSIDTEFR